MATHYISRHSPALLQRAAKSCSLLGPCLSATTRRHLHKASASGTRNELTRSSPQRSPSSASPRMPRQPYSTQAAAAAAAAASHHDPRSTAAAAATELQPLVHDVFEKVTGTWQYVVADPVTAVAAIIDPVLDYDPATGELSTESADALLSIVKENGYKVERILETHIHADHVTAAAYLQHALREAQGGDAPGVGIGRRIETVQRHFQKMYGIPDDEMRDAHQCLLDDDQTFAVGHLEVQAIHLPGHTPDHMGYKIGDNVFCGDSLFAADLGSARCDFPGGSAAALYDSGRKLLALPERVRVWAGHDYPPTERRGGRPPLPWQTVGEHRRSNRHLAAGVAREDFVAMREARDATLKEPRLLHPSLQMNVRGGRMPKMVAGRRMIQTPVRAVKGGWFV